MHTEDYIAVALDMVSALDIPDDEFINVVNAQARLMTGIDPDQVWGDNANTL